MFTQIQDDPAYTTTPMLFFNFYFFFFFYYGASAHFWAMASLLPGFQTVKFL
jgi:hypothetical protein